MPFEPQMELKQTKKREESIRLHRESVDEKEYFLEALHSGETSES